jgi:hypothetical protein
VLVSRERLAAFEDEIASLPLPRLDAPLAAAMPRGATSRLRGIGGLVDVTSSGAPRDVGPLARRLSKDVSRGPWLREIIVRNP